jgi:hypothetical protein
LVTIRPLPLRINKIGIKGTLLKINNNYPLNIKETSDTFFNRQQAIPRALPNLYDIPPVVTNPHNLLTSGR